MQGNYCYDKLDGNDSDIAAPCVVNCEYHDNGGNGISRVMGHTEFTLKESVENSLWFIAHRGGFPVRMWSGRDRGSAEQFIRDNPDCELKETRDCGWRGPGVPKQLLVPIGGVEMASPCGDTELD